MKEITDTSDILKVGKISTLYSETLIVILTRYMNIYHIHLYLPWCFTFISFSPIEQHSSWFKYFVLALSAAAVVTLSNLNVLYWTAMILCRFIDTFRSTHLCYSYQIEIQNNKKCSKIDVYFYGNKEEWSSIIPKPYQSARGMQLQSFKCKIL